MLFDWSERGTGRAGALVTAALGAWLFVGAGSVSAQQGAITGTVADAETLQPVAGAQVFVTGTVIGTLTGEQGTYRLEGVPAGQATVTVRLIGYKELSQTVQVQAGQVATADFAVEQTALKLQDIVVTGVVGATPRVKLPFVVERLDAADIPVPSSNISTLLTGKAAGVSVVRGSGQPGDAASVTLRGPTSIDASGRSQAPLIVIDGVIQSENATLADIGALDIDHVEIVKGAAAASLYGSRAQNGVIEVKTKRGTGLQTNSFTFMARGEYGLSDIEHPIGLADAHPFKMNASQTKFIDTNGDEVDFVNLGRPGYGGRCLDGTSCGDTQTAFADKPWTTYYDQLGRFFSPGQTYSGYGAVTGRFAESSFRVSFEEFKESGVVSCSECKTKLEQFQADRVAQGLQPLTTAELPEDKGYERQNARINVDTRFGQIDIAASGFYSRSRQDDSAVTGGAFFGLTFMSPGLDLTELDPETGMPRIDIDPSSAEENPLYNVAIGEHWNDRTRTSGSLDFSWAPIDWVTLEGNASYDRTDADQVDLLPKSDVSSEGGVNTLTGGQLDRFNFTDEAINASVTAGISRALMDGDLTLRAKARYLLEDQSFESNGVVGNDFSVEGVPTFGAIEGSQQGRRTIQDIKSEGYFGIASVDYKGRYIADGLVRRDGSSLFGADQRWHTYFRGSVAWRPSQEDWWNVDAIDELKFRFSYGTAGGRPRFSAQYETYGVGSGQIFPINLGNANLKPEFTREREAGVNLVLFENFGIDYTYAWANTEDQLLEVPKPAFVGYGAQWQNAGAIKSNTHEVSLRWAAIDESDVGLNFRVNWDRTQQEITDLAVPPYKTTGTGNDGAFYIAPGRPLGEIWGDRWATSCTEMAPVGISASDCAANFGINTDGFLVYTGQAGVGDGIAQGLWGTTSGSAYSSEYEWGMPIKVFDKSPVCVAENAGDPNDLCPLQNFLPLGNTTPDWNASFATNFRYGGLALSALLDASVGMDIYNGTFQWAGREFRGPNVVQTGVSDADKKPVAYYEKHLYDVNDTNSYFVEKGDWLKVRELSLGYTLPESVMESLFKGKLDRVTLSLIGRNLFTFTDYSGYDPEVGFSGGDFGSTALGRADRHGYPNFRTFTAALELVF